MYVAREVEVQILHRDDLRVAAPRGTALDPEDGPERRLAEAEDGAPPDHAEALRQRDRGRRLPLPRLRRRDRGHVDELRVRLPGEAIENREIDLRLVASVELDLLRQEAGVGGEVGYRAQRRSLGDLEARGHF